MDLFLGVILLIIALAIAAVIYMHRVDVATRNRPPYGAASSGATDGSDGETRIVKPPRPPSAA